MGQLDGRRMLEPVDEDALAFVGRVGVFSRAAQDGHAATLYPRSSPVQQGTGDFIVPDNFKETEETDAGFIMVIEPPVNSRRYPSDRLAIPPGQKVSNLGMSMIRMRPAQQSDQAQQTTAQQVAPKRGSPAKVLSIEPPGKRPKTCCSASA